MGVLSSVIILLPAILITCLFRKRRTRETGRRKLDPAPPKEPSTEVQESYLGTATANTSERCEDSLGHCLVSPTAELRETYRRCDTLTDPLELLPERGPSSLSTVQVEPSILGTSPGPSRLSGNLLSVQSARSTPDSGYRSPVRSRARGHVVPLEPQVRQLSPVYPTFYNPVTDTDYSSQNPYQIISAPNLSRALKTFSDSAQTYELWCTEQYNEKKRLEAETSGVETWKKSRPLPWWTIFIAYVTIFLSIVVSATFTLFYSLTWGGQISLEWMVSLFFSTSTGTFLIEPLKVNIFIRTVYVCVGGGD